MTTEEAMKEAQALYDLSKIHPLYSQVLLRREQVVIYRGNLGQPDYLFIGEAPGLDEAKIGKPFVGKSGKLLDKWLNHNQILNFCVTNAMTILPLDNDGKIRKPYSTDIAFFRPQLDKFIKAIDPKKIICLGKTASEAMDVQWRPLEWQGKIGIMYHPAYFLRGGMRGQGFEEFSKLLSRED